MYKNMLAAGLTGARRDRKEGSIMPLTLDEYKAKRETKEPKFEKAEKLFALLEDTDQVPYGTPLRSCLETLKGGVEFLARNLDDATDFGLELELNNLSQLKNKLRQTDERTKEPVEKALRELIMKQKDPQSCFDALQEIDEYYDLGLNVPEIQYGAEGLAKKKEEDEKKQIAEEKRIEAERAAEARKPSWQKYVELHRPKEDKQYKTKEKKELLAKMMVAANVHATNTTKDAEQKTPFNLDAARKFSSKLMDQWAFKHITRDPFTLNSWLEKEPAAMAEAVQKIRRPFAEMTVEERKEKIKELKDRLKYMDPREGRSSKYQRMYDSIDGITEEQLNNLEECDDPKKNGEELLQNVFNSTEQYQKGKKSLRSKPDQACRFDQSVDILACLGQSTPAAKNMTEGLIDRINDVRESHGQPQYASFECGKEENFRTHSNITRKYNDRMRAYRAQTQQGVQGLKEPKDPWAEPPKPRNILPKNENATYLDYEKYKDSGESLNKFTGDSGDFVDRPQDVSVTYWDYFKDRDMPLDYAKQTIASTLAAKKTPLLYSDAWKKVGCDETVFKANYQELMNDKAVTELAKKLSSPEARQKFFAEGQEMSIDTLNAEALEQEYQSIAQPAAAL